MKKAYLYIILSVFAAFTVVFDFLPRSTYSPLEKRELATFPELSRQSLLSGVFTSKVSQWFSDTEPFRDCFMTLSMRVKQGLALSLGSADDIVFHSAENGEANGLTQAAGSGLHDPQSGSPSAVNENAKIFHNGIIVVGSHTPQVRAFMAFGGSAKGGTAYAAAANAYKNAFGDGVRIYCMVIPTAAAFYCPEKARHKTNDQRATIDNIHRHLQPGVHAVDAYAALSAHKAEDIYLRTDHHWAPLGAYYAAEAFCREAGVPFKPLADYKREVVRRFVGSMYGYSQDISLKSHPEDFVYYVPQHIHYEVWTTDYDINENYEITKEHKPRKGIFFHRYRDGNGGAYCTFMGGDTRIVKVVTDTHSPRRVLILKDSFGNALPGYLFYSFSEVHVVDFRYFTKNMVDYVRRNKITDILFANNIFNAYQPGICRKFMRFLSQQNGIPHPPQPAVHQDSTVHHPAPGSADRPAEVREGTPSPGNAPDSNPTSPTPK